VKSALVISDRDNVATALEPLAAGSALDLNGQHVVVREPISPGHKFALVAIPAGDGVVKYGSRIGTASTAIAPGTHVHTHNVASDRGRGDLAHGRATRLAEPDAQTIDAPPATGRGE
jgi:SAF domain